MARKNKKKIRSSRRQDKSAKRKKVDYIEEGGPDTYDVVDTKLDISSDAIGSSDVEETPGDTTDRAGESDIPADIRGHGVGGITGEEVQPEPDTAGGTTGGGGNEGAEIGIDGLTNVGDADPSAGPDINANTDGSQAGQSGHQGIDEGTE